jgi:hypothetical protein
MKYRTATLSLIATLAISTHLVKAEWGVSSTNRPGQNLCIAGILSTLYPTVDRFTDAIIGRLSRIL